MFQTKIISNKVKSLEGKTFEHMEHTKYGNILSIYLPGVADGIPLVTHWLLTDIHLSQTSSYCFNQSPTNWQPVINQLQTSHWTVRKNENSRELCTTRQQVVAGSCQFFYWRRWSQGGCRCMQVLCDWGLSRIIVTNLSTKKTSKGIVK